MDEDIEIINTQTRNEKIKNFFINNKNSLISNNYFGFNWLLFFWRISI